MADYCYVIVRSDGQSMKLETERWSPTDERHHLPDLLMTGWEPVRETPMGSSDSDHGFSLVLLVKNR